jgi:hypothetical protein
MSALKKKTAGSPPKEKKYDQSEHQGKHEFALNIVIAMAIVLIAGVVVKRTFFPEPVNHPTLEQQAQVLLSTRINVPGADWAQNKYSLVFFLKKDCVYCAEAQC